MKRRKVARVRSAKENRRALIVVGCAQAAKYTGDPLPSPGKRLSGKSARRRIRKILRETGKHRELLRDVRFSLVSHAVQVIPEERV